MNIPGEIEGNAEDLLVDVYLHVILNEIEQRILATRVEHLLLDRTNAHRHRIDEHCAQRGTTFACL